MLQGLMVEHKNNFSNGTSEIWPHEISDTSEIWPDNRVAFDGRAL